MEKTQKRAKTTSETAKRETPSSSNIKSYEDSETDWARIQRATRITLEQGRRDNRKKSETYSPLKVKLSEYSDAERVRIQRAAGTTFELSRLSKSKSEEASLSKHSLIDSEATLIRNKLEMNNLTMLLDEAIIKGETPSPSETELSEYSFIDSEAALADVVDELADMVDTLAGLPAGEASLFLDLEGNNLSRHGTVSILQIHAATIDKTYLVDILNLGGLAFSTPGNTRHLKTTLKSLLEDTSIEKVFFDVRRDSDALFAHFGIELAGVYDLQLMELARRPPGYRRYVTGLARCIEKHAPLSAEERRRMTAVKARGVALFAPERGGSYAVFDARPLPRDIAEYCAQDVRVLPRLYAHYGGGMAVAWWEGVRDVSRERVELSQSPEFNGTGKHMTLGPTMWRI